MSKRMGQTLITALLPTTQHAWGQAMKAGGGGAKGFFNAVENVARSWGSPLAGAKRYFSGEQLGIIGKRMKWGAQANRIDRMGIRSERRATAGYLGLLGAMNVAVGDEGFMGWGKNSINTATAISAGVIAKPHIWRMANNRGGFGRTGIKGAAIGTAAWYMGNKLGVL